MTYLITALLLLFSTGSTILAQTDDTRSLRPYFFPYENFFKPQIYKYVDKNNPNNVHYWHMETNVVANDTILTTKGYDKGLNQMELFREKIGTEGSTLLEYTMIQGTLVTKSEAVDVEVYHWQNSKDNKIKWSVTYQSQYGHEYFSKTRAFISVVENKTFKNISYPSIQFKDTFIHSIKNKDSSDSYEFYQYNYYSKGLGTIEYKRFLPDGAIFHYCLNKVLTEKEWNKLKKKK